MLHYDLDLALTAPYHHVFQKISDKALGMDARADLQSLIVALSEEQMVNSQVCTVLQTNHANA